MAPPVKSATLTRTPYEDEERRGIALVLLCIPLTACVPIMGSIGSRMTDPLLFGALVSMVGSLFLVTLTWRELRAGWHRGIRSQMLKLFGVGLFGTALANMSLFKGLSITTGSNAAILLQVEPVYALILTFFVLREHPTKAQLLGTALIVSGAIAVLCPGTFRICRGDLLILVVPLLFVTANLLAQSCLHHGLSPRIVVTMRVTWGGVLLLPYVLFSGTWRTTPWDSPLFLSSLLAVSLLGAVLSSLLWYFAIARVSLSRCTSIMSAYPVVAVACSWIFLHEDPRISQIIGLGLVLTGISRLCRKESQSAPSAR